MQIRSLCKQKMKSEGGASLAVALLFFIVCAVVGSIIIAAAMSSAGRMSGIASADAQRFALDSARDLIEDTMLSDPEDDETWYVNESEIQAAVGSETWKGFSPKGGSLMSNLSDFQEVKLSMAEELYRIYWKRGEIRNSWPQATADSSTQGTITRGAVSAGTIASTEADFDTETISSWVPSCEIGDTSYPKRQATLSLPSSNDENNLDAAIPAVTAVFIMHPDFSIHITLSTNAAAQKNTANVGEEKFVLYPSLSMDYESVKPQADGGELTTAANQKKIRCVIQWLSTGEEQPETASGSSEQGTSGQGQSEQADGSMEQQG